LHCKWMRRLLGLLLERPHRTSELKRALPGISSKVLSERLRRLEMLGLITRTVSAERPLRVIYSATERARPLAEHADGDKKTGSPVTVMVSSAPQNCSRSKGS
jgi:DNA-binding HxlR family transcriptional regulator